MASSQPLIALDAVVLDTETTGLDPQKARILQIGAVRLVHGHVTAGGSFDEKVNPGEPIPPASTQIHGIDDAAVANARRFGAVFSDLEAYLGQSVIIGHNIGFDLAMLTRECRLAGLSPPKNRLLDTRILGEIAFPRLGGFTLEAMAGHLGISVDNRHDALADAELTAAVFLGLLPHLKANKIRTLAEAEAACRRMTELLDQLGRAGWVDPVRPVSEQDAALSRIDAFPFRHRVQDVASMPPIWLAPGATLREAICLMAERAISSVLVSATPEALIAPVGIITERDVIRLVAAKTDLLEQPIGALATRPILTVPANAFIYRAIGRMESRHIRHLGVTDEAGMIIGAISARDLLRLRSSDALALGDAVDEAQSLGQIAAAWGRIPQVAKRLLGEGVPASEIAAVISREIGALTRRAAIEAEKHMIREGHGAPPAPYATLILGSGGRGESLLIPDQDNATIFAAVAPDALENANRWFLLHGAVMAEILDAVGIPLCKGKVMASNPAWNGDIESWRSRISSWTQATSPKDLLSVDIFFDFRHAHGDHQLSAALTEFAREAAGNARAMVKLLSEQIGQWASPLGMFGRLKTEEGRIDLKKSGLLPIVSAARCLALSHGIGARSTGERLTALRAMQIGADSDLELFSKALGFFQSLVLRQQLADIAAGIPPTTKVDPSTLSKADTALLKDMLAAVGNAGDITHSLLFTKAGLHG
jgi:DNA polymerase-3 subunit epsilon/CBS domain-containing protein